VVRAAAASTIPLISAVGHETDTTLIDFVSDRRAPTPTAAAEIAVPVRRDLLLQAEALGGRLEHALDRRLDQLAQMLDGLARGLPRPEMLLGMAGQRLDDLSERLRLRSPGELVRLQAERLEARRQRLAELLRDRLRRAEADLCCQTDRLVPELILARLALLEPRVTREGQGLDHGLEGCLERARAVLEAQARQLEALGHTKVLERGYAIVRARGSGHVVPRLAALGTESELDILFHDGLLPVRRADGAAAAAAPAPAAPSRGGGGGGRARGGTAGTGRPGGGGGGGGDGEQGRLL
jgi:exodeoxyribonuclease VII large subunit